MMMTTDKVAAVTMLPATINTDKMALLASFSPTAITTEIHYNDQSS